jgi:hypothetical protein
LVVRAPFDQPSLVRGGFVGFLPVRDLLDSRISEIRESHGEYGVLWQVAGPPIFLEAKEAGRFKAATRRSPSRRWPLAWVDGTMDEEAMSFNEAHRHARHWMLEPDDYFDEASIRWSDARSARTKKLLYGEPQIVPRLRKWAAVSVQTPSHRAAHGRRSALPDVGTGRFKEDIRNTDNWYVAKLRSWTAEETRRRRPEFIRARPRRVMQGMGIFAGLAVFSLALMALTGPAWLAWTCFGAVLGGGGVFIPQAGDDLAIQEAPRRIAV